MRRNRMLMLLAVVASMALTAASALACDGSSTKVSGTFDKTGHFVLSGAWGPDGAPIANAKGIVLASFTTVDNLVVPAASLAGKQVCLFGNLDVTGKTMQVAGYQECPAGCKPGQCDMKGASAAAASAGAGAGCCAAKGASASAAGAGKCPAMASAASAGAGAGAGCCASKGASASSASAGHCPAMTSTMSAGGASHCPAMAGAAGAAGHCTAPQASAASAGAPGCCSKGAAASAASAPTCHGDAASAKTASATTTTENAAVNTVVYKVSGMHCEHCASKVQGAVTSLSLPNVTGCTVNLEKGQAVVTTKGDVDRQAIQKAITAAGFPAEISTAEATTTKS
ncbi:MAG: heavy metal-associated domain-containing protein [bacterium]